MDRGVGRDVAEAIDLHVVAPSGVELNVRRVAVATDRSVGGDRALRWALHLGGQLGASIAVIQILTAPAATDENGNATAAGEGSGGSDRTRPARVDLLEAVGPGPEVIVQLSDEVAEAIVAAATGFDADLLVIGNGGMRDRTEFLLGNVANRVTHLARCSVLVVNANQVGEITTQVAADPSPTDRARELLAILTSTSLTYRRDARRGGSRSATIVRECLEELGPTFCKLGQMLSTRPDLIPADLATELARLQSNVPPMTEQQVVKIMERELGVPWEDVFATIEPTPLAAGTIGQVHRATLATGHRVVVKVQREAIEATINNDLRLLELLADPVSRSRRVRGLVDLPGLLNELGASLRAELDFRSEAANLDRMADILESFDRVAVPRCHHELSTGRLLVMDEIPGIAVSDAPDGPDTVEAARQLLCSFFSQILDEGFFHADPHPGNLMWHDGQIWLLDLGMVGKLDSASRGRLVLLLLAVGRGDAGLVAELAIDADGSVEGPKDPEGYRSDLADLITGIRDHSLRDLDLAELLDQMTRLAVKHRVPLPTELVMVGKAIGQVQNSVAQLAPDLDPMHEATRYLGRSLIGRFTRQLNPEQLIFELERARYRFGQIGDALVGAAGSAPGGKLELGVRSAAMEDAITRAGRMVGLGASVGMAWIAVASSRGHSQRRAMSAVAAGLTAAFGAVISRR